MIRFDIQTAIKNIIAGDDSRLCDECTACCSVMGVTELDKGPNCDCVHLIPLGRIDRSGGCDNYADRPHSCREFVCLWKHRALESDEYRPDKLGLIFTLTTEASVGTPNQSGDGLYTLILAHAVWAGSPEEERQKYILGQLSKNMLIFVCDDYLKKRVLIGPERQVREATAKLQLTSNQ